MIRFQNRGKQLCWIDESAVSRVSSKKELSVVGKYVATRAKVFQYLTQSNSLIEYDMAGLVKNSTRLTDDFLQY